MTIPKRFTPVEAANGRKVFTEVVGRDVIARGFGEFPELRSAYLCVAQFWNDEALDQVHFEIVYSELELPDMAAGLDGETNQFFGEEPDLVNLPTVSARLRPWLRLNQGVIGGADEGNEIAMFAAFCKEDCDQEMESSESFTPYALYRRSAGADGFSVEVVGEMLRPWLDGVKPLEDGSEEMSSSEVMDAFVEIYVEGRPGGSGLSVSGSGPSTIRPVSTTPVIGSVDHANKKPSLLGRLFGRKR